MLISLAASRHSLSGVSHLCRGAHWHSGNPVFFEHMDVPAQANGEADDAGPVIAEWNAGVGFF